MSSDKLEYDSTLGGSITLPTHVPTYRYAAGVVQELHELLDEVRHPTSRKLVFQTLPKHMRRRAMSHHPKRLPRKHRVAHRSQMAKAGKPQQTKRPSRKHRRRPANLLRDYLRRQRRNIWLETHIWHAKRFHMVNRWGYRLPSSSCDKTYRACYRASTTHCLLQDMSFHACIELRGRLAQLREGFARLSSMKCGLSITARTYIDGRREGSIDLFRDGQYPDSALGRVSFMWCPAAEGESAALEDATRTLWLWIHPSAYQAILEELIKVFELCSTRSIKVPINSEDTVEPEVAKDEESNPLRSKQQRRLQFMTKTLAYERIKRYHNTQSCVTLSELKDTMNRFRLTGHLSQSVLFNAFKPKQIHEDKQPKWLENLHAEQPYLRQAHATQSDYWQRCQEVTSPAELLSNMIIGLNIEDPRLHRPQKRTKALPAMVPFTKATLDLLINMPECLPQSALWRHDVRDSICNQLLSTRAYNDLRAKHAVVPGAPCNFEAVMQPVPVLLIQRPGSQQPQYNRRNYGCGWDVIAPAGYGMPIWLSLIMWGARPGGLREFESIARESGTEQHLPDTIPGRQLAIERHLELSTKYFRKPPNKRYNYRKVAIVSPFRAPFAQLLRDWTSTESNVSGAFHILRERAPLQQLLAYIQRKSSVFPKEITIKCLIQLQLRMKTRGNAADFALICLPTLADFKRNLKQLKRENHEPVYTEPLAHDPAEQERKRLRQTHKKLLKRLRARRVREKRRKQETSNMRVHIAPAGTASLVAAQYKRMCSLWLPEDFSALHSVRKQCSREVFGYATTAHFSYIEATVCAVGYVTAGGLEQLLALCRQARMRQPMCLLRSPTSRHYRFANFKLNLET